MQQLIQLYQGQKLPQSIMISSLDQEKTVNTLIRFIQEYLLVGYNANLHNNPDFLIIKKEKSIGIDKVRVIRDFLNKTIGFLPYKILIFTYANHMTTQAMNGCLKIFEEVPPNSYIFLVTQNLYSISPTLRSRFITIVDSHTYESISENDYNEFLSIIFDSQKSFEFCLRIREEEYLWEVFYKLFCHLLNRLVKYKIGSLDIDNNLELDVFKVLSCSGSILSFVQMYFFAEERFLEVKQLSLNKFYVSVELLKKLNDYGY